MRILFYFGHPSQYLFLRNSIKLLRSKQILCDILIKSKDILENLLIQHDESYKNILPEGRGSSKLGIISGLIKRDLRLYNYTRKKKYDLFIGTDPSLAHIGFIRKIPVITVLEDDITVIPQLAKTTFPFSSLILTPTGCKMGKYEFKTIHYDGYMKLAYLHPTWFLKEPAPFRQPYFLIRISSLQAYHDTGIKGFTMPILRELVSVLQKKGAIYISSELPVEDSMKQFELRIDPIKIHQVLYNARMLISDSQSMTMEAAMLGVPSVRFSDFAGKISVLEELEHKYKLTFGIPAHLPEKLFRKIEELLNMKDLQKEFSLRRFIMLANKIDVTAFLVWFIQNYPMSVNIIRKNPDYHKTNFG